MRLIIGIFSFALAGAALADCKEDLFEVDQLSAKVQTGDVQRAQLAQMREAALLLIGSGRDSLCQDVVDGMEDLLDKQRKANMMASERNERLQRVRTATPISAAEGVVRASRVIGLPVKSEAGDRLGTIEDIAIDAGSGVVAYVALAHGGFLGLGEKWIAVPWRELSSTKDDDAIVLEIPEESLEKMAGFDEDNWPQTYGAGWMKEVGAAGPKPQAPAK
ncbi:MAG TPA: PRC-barrel domain-containing protein [Burkholderiales bacterium]|nr:PRC-barrel domain-containing protein [Burkholderiales bacterium]